MHLNNSLIFILCSPLVSPFLPPSQIVYQLICIFMFFFFVCPLFLFFFLQDLSDLEISHALKPLLFLLR